MQSTRFVCVNVDSTWRKSICARLIAHLCFEGALKNLSIRHDSIESTRPVSVNVDSTCRKSNCVRLIFRAFFNTLSTKSFSGIGNVHESSRIVKNLRRIDSSLLSRFKNEEGSCIIISRVLTSGGADQLLTNRVESSSTSDESTQFGCIGHGCLTLRDSGYGYLYS